MPSPNATSGALIRINAFSDVVKDVKVSGVKFQLPSDYQWQNMHEFFMVFIQGNSEEASSTLSNITVENCTFDYTTAPDAPEGISLSTAIAVNTTEITEAENITIKNNTFLMKTSNTDCNFGAIWINGTANDSEKGIIISGNKIYGGLPNTGRAPFGIIIESPNTVGASSRQNDTLHVKLNNNSFYGKDVQGNVVNFLELLNIGRNALDIQLEMTENEFGTLAAPIVGNDKNNCIIWIGFNNAYPSGNVEFTNNSNNNSYIILGNQCRSLADFVDSEIYQIKMGGQNMTTLQQLSGALASQENYNVIVNSVDSLDSYLNEDIPKIIYTLPGSYSYQNPFSLPQKNFSVIGPLSPDYPLELVQGEAEFSPATITSAFFMMHAQSNPEEAKDEDFQRENSRFSGLSFAFPVNFETEEYIPPFFEFGVKNADSPAPNWYLHNLSIDHCVFDSENAPHGMSCILYNNNHCDFEDITISNNSFYLRRVENGVIAGIDGAGGSSNPEKSLRINNNHFYGSEISTEDGNRARCMVCWGTDKSNIDQFYLEIKNNLFEGNLEYANTMMAVNDKDEMNIELSGNQYGTAENPFRNDLNERLNSIWFLEKIPVPVRFNETGTKNIYYASTPDATVILFSCSEYGEGQMDLYYGQQKMTAQEISEQLFTVVK